MSIENLGIKQLFKIHNCLINDEKYDLVITPHRQTKGYIKTKKHYERKLLTNINKLLGNDFQNEETQVPKKRNLKGDTN